MRGESAVPMFCPGTGARSWQGSVDLTDVLHTGQGGQGAPAGHLEDLLHLHQRCRVISHYQTVNVNFTAVLGWVGTVLSGLRSGGEISTVESGSWRVACVTRPEQLRLCSP